MMGVAGLRRGYRRAILRRFVLLVLPLAVLLGGVAAAHYYGNLRLEQVTQESSESLNVELARRTVLNDLRTVISDLSFLSQLNEMHALLDRPSESLSNAVAQEFLAFSQQKRLYDQIRVLDTHGLEVIRVNYNNGNPGIVPKGLLQDKVDRYYVQNALALGPNQIYISPFDLNVENGQVEVPPKPVIRLATPLFDSHGRKRGLLVFNFLGGKLIQNFRQAAANIADHIMLINPDGYWLSSPQPQDEWGFVFEHGRSFPRDCPQAWRLIQQDTSGQFYNQEGLFTFTTVYPLEPILQQLNTEATLATLYRQVSTPADASRSWKIVARVSPVVLQAAPENFLRRNASIYTAMGLLLLGTSLVIARAGVRHHLADLQTEYERRFRNTMETVQLAAVTLDNEGRILFCNDFMLDITGWSAEDVAGRDWFETFIPEQDRQKERTTLSRIVATGIFPTTHENRIITRDGMTRLFTWNNTLSVDSDEQIIGVTSIGEDVTEQRRSEEQLHKLSRAVEQSPSTVLITNTDGVIEYVNPNFTRLTGYTPEEVIGKTPRVLQSGATTSDQYHGLWETIKRGEQWRGILQNRKKNGELYWEYTLISPIRNTDGQITHFIAVKEDITERKRLEQEVEQRNRELAHAEALSAMGRVASMIAHDLRNPLSSIKMGLQILGKDAVKQSGEQAAELKQIALDQVRHMEDILTDFLQISRPDALNLDWLSVDKLLDLVISVTQKVVQEHGAQVITEYQPHLPTVHGDATKLRQAFTNLIINALQATEDTDQTPVIRVRACLELCGPPPKIRVEICDNGPGIDPEQAEKLFEPFYTTRATGTGLGLAIVKRILDQHHGAVSLGPGDSGGTCATVILPTGPIEQ